jgi:hypothetical protein
MFKSKMFLCFFSVLVIVDSIINVINLDSGKLIVNAVILLAILLSLVIKKLLEDYLIQDEHSSLYIIDLLTTFILVCVVGLDIYLRYF